MSFYHQLMIEYFAAVGLSQVGISHVYADMRSSKQLVTSRGIYAPVLYATSRWAQVVIALCGITPNPMDVVSIAATVDPLLAEACIATGIDVSQSSVLPILLESLQNVDAKVRNSALMTLGRMADPITLPALLPLLGYNDESVRTLAAQSIARIGKPTIPHLIENLNTFAPHIVKASIRALVYMGTGAFEALLEATAHSRVPVRANAIQVLTQLKSTDAIPALIARLNDDDPFVRSLAAKGLGELKAQSAVSSLIVTLNDSDARVRTEAATAVGLIKDKTAIPHLLNLMFDKVPTVHLAVYDALKGSRSRRATSILKKAL